MSQPEWKLEWATDYSALYTDETGVYPPELEILEEVFDAPEDERFLVFRVSLERCKEHENFLIPFNYDETWPNPVEEYREWYCKGLDLVALSAGRDEGTIRAGICSPNPNDRAQAYQDIAGYHGWENFDSYPICISETQADNWPDWRNKD